MPLARFKETIVQAVSSLLLLSAIWVLPTWESRTSEGGTTGTHLKTPQKNENW